MAADPVFDDNSVRNTINAMQARIIIHGVENKLISTVANHNEVPVSPNTTDKHNPPPKSSKMPQPILSSKCFQEISLNAGANAVIKIAIILSKFLRPKIEPIGLEKIQQMTVNKNKAIVPFASGVHFIEL